jgi:uncharacterized protein
MSDEVIAAAANFVFRAAPGDQQEFRFLWHAGEPLTAGIKFYKRAFEIIAQRLPEGASVVHTIQTNGTLVNEAWCELFKQHQVDIGISIDGPQHLHDSNRVSWSGKGSFDRALRGFHMLRSHGFDPGALCVLTRESLNCPDEIYDFFVEQGFSSVGFNVEESEGANARSSLLSSTPDELLGAYKKFMRRMWRRWLGDGRLYIREFAQELAALSDVQRIPGFVREPDEVIPFAILTIRRDGAISTFAPELASTQSDNYRDFIIGNVLTDSPENVWRSDAYRHLTQDVRKGREECQDSCPYFVLCGSGFQSNRIAENGSLLSTETSTCRIHRMALTDVVITELETIRY